SPVFPGCGCDRTTPAAAAGARPPRRAAAAAAAAAAAGAPGAAAPLHNADSSGEAELDEAAALRTALPDSLRLARLLRDRAAELQEEMCDRLTICANSVEMLLHNNLNLPKVTEEDGCLLAGFDEDKCLRKISSGLYTFQTYLKYVQETFISENQNIGSLTYSTEHLARTIRQMVMNPEEVIIPDADTQKSLHTKLKSTKAWIEKITIHLILRDFTSFMEKTVRAVRYMKNTRSFSV
uniref:Interleukin-6 n=1 Tax=Malurus cyaneus samueli TaxID=2593467 RepID=A0A8C5TU82_9PASS